MAIHVITQEQLEEFDDEAPTEPDILRIQDQLNAATSVAGFTERLRRLRPHWTERLATSLEEKAPKVDTGPGWAGRVTR